jgi:Putative zinc-finger
MYRSSFSGESHMEHSYIEEHNIDGRYLLGDLSVEERMRFEEHFIDCRHCRDRLKAIEALRAGLRTVAAEEASRSRAFVQAGLLARVVRLRRTVLLAGVILLVALPIALLSREWSGARRDLARSEQTSSEWRRKYEEREQAARNLTREVQESSAQREQLAAQLAREREKRVSLADQLNRAAGTEAVVPIFALSVTRGDAQDSSQTAEEITIPRSSKLIILSLELETDPDIQSYRATLSTAGGRSVWSKSNLKPGPKDALALSLNAKLFKPDNYRLTLAGLTVGGRYVPVAQSAFRVLIQ